MKRSYLISLLGVLLSLILLSGSFVMVSAGQEAVLLNWGRTVGTLAPGLHLVVPLKQHVDIYDVFIQKYQVPATGKTKDLQNLNAEFAVNFSIDPGQVETIRNRQGTLSDVVERLIGPQTQESFKIATAHYTAEETIQKRDELKAEFDEAITLRLAPYGVLVHDTSVVELNFDSAFADAVEQKQIKEQEALRAHYEADEAAQKAQARVNQAEGEAKAQSLLIETLKSQGGQLLLQKEAIEAWRSGGAQMPKVLVSSGDKAALPPFLFNAQAD
jgi:prohibitin 1